MLASATDSVVKRSKNDLAQTEMARQEWDLGVLDNHVKVIVFNQVVELL